MRKVLWVAMAILTLMAVAADPADESKPQDSRKGSPLEVGNNLPGPFHPYNVTGPNRGHFHCPVSDRGLQPFVLVFVRNLELPDALKTLLTQLEEASEKSTTIRLESFAVFLSDDLPDVFGGDDKTEDQREKLIEKISDLNNSLNKPKHVTLCLDGATDLKAYQLKEDAEVTVLLVKKSRIVACHFLAHDKLTADVVKTIRAEVDSKLTAAK
jgi:hypothetical protein